MKVYIITDKDIENLLDKLELEKFQRREDEEISDPKYKINELYRFFNYHVHDWVSEISK